MQYQQIGGLKIGRNALLCWNIGWPFARFLVAPDALEIRVFLFGVTKKYRFVRDDVSSLRVMRTTFSRVLVIEHRNSTYAKFIAWESFPTRHFQQLHDNLKACDYNVLLDD